MRGKYLMPTVQKQLSPHGIFISSKVSGMAKKNKASVKAVNKQAHNGSVFV